MLQTWDIFIAKVKAIFKLINYIYDYIYAFACILKDKKAHLLIQFQMRKWEKKRPTIYFDL